MNTGMVDQGGELKQFIVTFSDPRGGTGATGLRMAQVPAATTAEVAEA